MILEKTVSVPTQVKMEVTAHDAAEILKYELKRSMGLDDLTFENGKVVSYERPSYFPTVVRPMSIQDEEVSLLISKINRAVELIDEMKVSVVR